MFSYLGTAALNCVWPCCIANIVGTILIYHAKNKKTETEKFSLSGMVEQQTAKWVTSVSCVCINCY